tara:strand:+ start:802 stop:1299 length:498 start_codon:yes stop_codon:yes gene_type:complete
MSSLTKSESLQLKKLVAEMGSTDQTDNIRKLKHSTLIRDDIRRMDTIAYKYNLNQDSDKEKYREECIKECNFLYTNYNDIFNGISNQEMNLTILTKFLTILKLIEDNKIDQNEGSVMVGKLLKELYIDSALKRSENLDNKYKQEKGETIVEKKISWKEYKNLKSN